MKRLWPTIQLDVALQAKSNLYSIGVCIAVAMGFSLRYLFEPHQLPVAMTAFFVLALGGTTMMFGASMLLLEKSQGTLSALRITPIRSRDYISSKVLTLTTFATAESAIAFLIAGAPTPQAPFLLALGLCSLGAMYALVGLWLAVPHQSVTQFLFPGAALASIVLQLPVLSLWGLGPDWLWWLIPTTGPMQLIHGGLSGISAPARLSAFVLAGLYLATIAFFCRRRFQRWIRFCDACTASGHIEAKR